MNGKRFLFATRMAGRPVEFPLPPGDEDKCAFLYELVSGSQSDDRVDRNLFRAELPGKYACDRIDGALRARINACHCMRHFPDHTT